MEYWKGFIITLFSRVKGCFERGAKTFLKSFAVSVLCRLEMMVKIAAMETGFLILTVII